MAEFNIVFANRINYRDHRKIIVVDGLTGYVGGINVSDQYINSGNNKLFWRDTRTIMAGASALNLQWMFLSDWNFSTGQEIAFSENYLPLTAQNPPADQQLVQIAASGPNSDYSSIMYPLMQPGL